jgi:hypothetical protein
MNKNKASEDLEIKNDIKRLVIERIKATSDELEISIGSTRYTKEQILDSVEKEDEIGKEIIDIQIEYLRDMAQGALYRNQ